MRRQIEKEVLAALSSVEWRSAREVGEIILASRPPTLWNRCRNLFFGNGPYAVLWWLEDWGVVEARWKPGPPIYPGTRRREYRLTGTVREKPVRSDRSA